MSIERAKNILTVANLLARVQSVEIYKNYKAVTGGDGIDFTTYIYELGLDGSTKFVDAVNWGFSEGWNLDFPSYVDAGRVGVSQL